MKYFIKADFGCVYRMNDSVLEFAPMYHLTPHEDGFDDEEFAEVEFDILDEPVLSEAKLVAKILRGEV